MCTVSSFTGLPPEEIDPTKQKAFIMACVEKQIEEEIEAYKQSKK